MDHRFRPHNYQRRAIEHVEDHPWSLLFLDMGLGKTVITLTAIRNLIDHAEVNRVLIVAPKKVAETTWRDEVAKWPHLRGQLTIGLALGDPEKRLSVIQGTDDIVVMSRDSLRWLYDRYHRRKRFPFDMLVIDELSGFKSHDSQRFRVVRWMRRHLSRIVGLTGTPIPNGMIDLWAQVYCVDGGERLGDSFANFRETYFSGVMHNNIWIKIWLMQGAEQEIRDKIADITLTMRSEDWLELPAMVETDVDVELSDVTLEWYHKFEREKILELKDRHGDLKTLTAESAAPLAVKLSQYANGQVYDEDRGVIETHERKLRALEEILEADERPLLVFYQYKHDLDRIMKTFKHLKPRQYQGEKELKDWNEGKIRLLLAHPASTAYGLNMQYGGHRIVWYSTGWNLELYQQANARLHRQGQREQVTVMRLVARGTIDERMTAAISGKEATQRDFLEEMKKYIQAYETK